MALETFRSTLWSKFGKALTVLIAVAFVGSMARGMFFPGGSTPRLEKGRDLPRTQLIDVESGKPLRLESLRGRPVLINFWATWCGYCVKELPMLEGLHRRFGDSVAMLAVTEEELPKVRYWLGQAGAPHVTFPVIYDPGNGLGAQLGVRKIPFTVFLDRAGRVAHDVTGVVPESEAVERLEALLK